MSFQPLNGNRTEADVPEKQIGLEFVQSETGFIYFALFFIPLVTVCNVIVTVSSFMTILEKREHKCAYLSLFNISLGNVILCAAFLYGLIEINSVNDKYICTSQLGCIISGCLTSMMSICIIAVERYFYVVHGRKYDSYLTTCKTGLIIFMVWILGICFGLLPTFIEAGNSPGDTVPVCEILKSPLPVIIAALILSVLSLVITPIAYTILYHRIKKMWQNNPAGCKTPKFKFKSILVVLISSVTFLICWGPFILGLVIYKFYCEPTGLQCHKLELAVASPLACLGFSNTLVNPLIYAWWHPPYNTALKKVLCPERPLRAKSRGSLLRRPTNAFVKTIS